MSDTKKTKGVLIEIKDLKKEARRAALAKALAALPGKEDDKPEKKPVRVRKKPKNSG